jgi:hypothetical protein
MRLPHASGTHGAARKNAERLEVEIAELRRRLRDAGVS